jgi:precorrin-6B C5,15-methyltransferase / cobalt-precorrin-6B C5,C15-methyltransferase
VSAWLAVVGIGEDGLAGLSVAARTLIDTAEVLVGGDRHHAMVPRKDVERLVWERPLGRTIEAIADRRGQRVVVLASGDPLWYGIGVALLRRFPRVEMTILPQPSAFSLAAARLGWPLAECRTITLHGRPLDRLRLDLAPNQRLLILAQDGGTPSAVARLLTESGWGASPLTVFAHLGGARETIFKETARSWGYRLVADLNTIAIECHADPGIRVLARLAGLPDDAFEHDGQLTKREVRAATLAALMPLPGETLWDVGAGCGSIAIEWLRAGARCRAVAIEREPARVTAIARNAATLGVPELEIVLGTAPAAFAGLPPPDAVFIGGGIDDAAMLPAIWAALLAGGRIVANVVTVAAEARLIDWRARHGGTLTRIAVCRAEPAGAHHLWRPLAPVTQYAAVKPARI